MRLARLAGGGAQQAKVVAQLAATYRKFDEGFDTPDLVEARELLELLGDGVAIPRVAPRAQITGNQANRTSRNS
jgi:hypothetical protein